MSGWRASLAIVTVTCGLFVTPAAADEVIDWNQVLASALTATNTSPQNSGRIAAMTHAAIFDAVNGIERRYPPYFITDEAPRGASSRACGAGRVCHSKSPPASSGSWIRAAARCVDCRDRARGQSVERGIAWGEFVANARCKREAPTGFRLLARPISAASASASGGPRCRARRR